MRRAKNITAINFSRRESRDTPFACSFHFELSSNYLLCFRSRTNKTKSRNFCHNTVTNIFFCQQTSLFRQLYRFFVKWGLCFAKWGLFFASLNFRKSPAVLFNLCYQITPLHHCQCRFRQPNLKLLSLSPFLSLSLSVQLERSH